MPGRIAAVDISLILAAAAPIVVIAAMLIAQRVAPTDRSSASFGADPATCSRRPSFRGLP
jgi:hypothetical protein